MKGKLAIFVFAIMLLSLGACTSKELCPAYSSTEEVVSELPDAIV